MFVIPERSSVDLPFHYGRFPDITFRFMFLVKLLPLILSFFVSQIAHSTPVPLTLKRSGGVEKSVFQEKDGSVQITGSMGLIATPATAPGEKDTVIELEYFCLGGVPKFSVISGPPFDVAASRMLPAMGHSEGWTSYTARIAPEGKTLPEGWKQLRLELPLKPGQSLQIRNVRLRPESPGEFDPQVAKPNASASKGALEKYLSTNFSGEVTKVSIGKDYIQIEGKIGSEKGEFALADIPIDIVLDDPRSWQTIIDITPSETGAFKLDVPRYRKRGGLDYDRLTSRWQIVLKENDGYVQKSHACYGGKIESRGTDLPAAKPKNKKGLGGWNAGRIPGELEELGISAVTINVMASGYISLKQEKGTVPTVWQGRTYHMRVDRLGLLDKNFREAAKHNAMVSAIVLLGNPAKSADPVVKMMGHPDALPAGIFAMPNVTSPEGIGIYGAVLNFLAERYSRPDGKYGRVHHWIMQNEVDAGWVWTNAGDKPAIVYMDLYQRSMRLMDLIASQYNPRSRPFISLTHHWAYHGAEHWYGSKLMIDLLGKFSATEGDFPWGVAYHPYPEDLRNPRTWEDEQATFSFDSKKITPKNLEVLDAYMKTPKMLFRGTVRPVHLSENGFNSPDYSAKSLEDQAAGMALAYKKMEKLSSIESWQYHNWIDNRAEGGLMIGLRKYPDQAGDPSGKKPIWYLYKALGTPQEDEVARPYLKTIGIQSWDQAIYKGEIK